MALSVLFPDVDKTNLIDRGGVKVPYVGIRDSRRRMPVKRLGDGAMRMFGLALGLASAKNGILLIDEVENGLHYSVQAQVWKLVLRAAERLKVQVFATTHSRDTVNALAEAAGSDDANDAMVYRIQRRDDRLFAVSFAQGELKFAVEQELEVR